MNETKVVANPFVVRTPNGSLYQYTARETMETAIKGMLAAATCPSVTIYVADEVVETQTPPVKRFPVDIR